MNTWIISAFAGFFLILVGCGVPISETIAGQASGEWVLKSVNDAPPPARLSIRFTETGALEGTGPCNQFGARQTAPLPWFELTDMFATERACDGLAEETVLLDQLGRMKFAEITGDTLLLSGGDEESLLFRRGAKNQ